MHFAAGPWFTVNETPQTQMRTFGDVWWSDGVSDGPAHLEMSTTLLPPSGALVAAPGAML